MKQEDLRILLSRKMSKEEIFAFSRMVNPCNCDRIFPLIADKDRILSANVAHLCFYAGKDVETWLSGEAPKIMQIVQTTAHEKTRRLLMAILEKIKFDTTNIDVRFLDYCIDGIVSPKVPSAIKVLCIKLAFKQSAAYSELLSELKMILETMDSSMLAPSVVCARKNILKRIAALL